MVLGAFIAVLSLILFLRNSAKYANLLKISILPTCTSLSIFLMFFIPRMNIEGADLLFSTPSYLSIGVLLCSILFVFGSLTSAIVLILSKRLPYSKLITWPIICLIFFHMLVTIFLISQKVIPMITWSWLFTKQFKEILKTRLRNIDFEKNNFFILTRNRKKI